MNNYDFLSDRTSSYFLKNAEIKERERQEFKTQLERRRQEHLAFERDIREAERRRQEQLEFKTQLERQRALAIFEGRKLF